MFSFEVLHNKWMGPKHLNIKIQTTGIAFGVDRKEYTTKSFCDIFMNGTQQHNAQILS